MKTPEFLRDVKPTGNEECVVCHKRLKGKFSWIGFNTDTASYTYDEKLATQGWFPIGKDCEKTLIKRGDILGEQ